MGSLVIILLYVIKIVWFIVIAHVIMSWLIGFNVLNRHQPLVWRDLERAEPAARADLRADPPGPARHGRPRPVAAGALVDPLRAAGCWQRNAAAFF